MANPNLQLLTDAAELLRPILGELVFVGGCDQNRASYAYALRNTKTTTPVIET
jgi:hypothetical protein